MKKIVLAVSLLICSVLFSFGQKEANVWYFGNMAGLDFNSGAPMALLDGQMNTNEGCASIADKTTGKILFYTDGTSVWNSNGTVMPGSVPGLLGNFSATQSAICVPMPGSTTKYYIFTVDGQAGAMAPIGPSTTGYGGVAYSIVDMTLQGGLGDISTLNTQLITPTSEKVTAVRHCNGHDLWIVTHGWNSNTFYAYLLSSSGLAAPVTTNVGIVHSDVGSGQNAESIGYMKFSPNGKKLAVACYNELNTVQIFDFNNSTGVISNPITDTNFPNFSGFQSQGPYGISFSPDNSRLYVGIFGDVFNILFPGTSYVYQYNMNAGSNAAILASKTTVHTDGADNIGALQIGPDGKIYVAKNNNSGSNYLDVINNPNALGTSCGYTADALYLGTVGSCLFGLPDMVESYLSVPITATMSYNDCSGSHTVSFTDNALNGTITTSWNFGDPASGASNTSNTQNPSHTFSSGGTYTVTVYFSTACAVDSFKKSVTLGGGGAVTAGPDSSICSGNYVQLHTSPGTTYSWSPGKTLSDSTSASPFAFPTTTTTYTVTVSSNGCSSTATVTINVATSPPVPGLTLSNDTLYCSHDPSYTSYQWYDSSTIIPGATKDYLVVTHNGNYNVSVRNENGCSIAVGINVVLTGISDFLPADFISLSPNPAEDQLKVHGLQFTSGQIAIEVYNVLGQKVYTELLETRNSKLQSIIDVSQLAKGVYLLRVSEAEGKWVGRFVKE